MHARVAAEAAFRRRFGKSPTHVARAAGRVNLLGAHVDYHEGLVLPAAIDRSIWLAFEGLDEPRIELESLDLPASLDWRWGEGLGGALREWRERVPGGDWRHYPVGCVWALAETLGAGAALPGLRGVLASDLPRGAGVSSSAALEVAVLLALDELGDLGLARIEVAGLGRRVENEFLGLGSGLLDQFASVHGQEGSVLLFDCRSLAWRPLPLGAGLGVLVVDSGVRRELTSSGFNDRRAESLGALRTLQEAGWSLSSLRDLEPERLEEATGLLPAEGARRVRHVVEEIQRVRDGAAALEAGDRVAFGRLIDASHASSRDLYQVSTPELDDLQRTLSGLPGCLGARLSGGGFGGCVTALVEIAAAEAIGAEAAGRFRARFGRSCPAFLTRPAAGAEIFPAGRGGGEETAQSSRPPASR